MLTAYNIIVKTSSAINIIISHLRLKVKYAFSLQYIIDVKKRQVNIVKNYHTRLKDLREDCDLTQAQVAEIIQTSQQHYGKYESGKIVIPFDRVIMLAEYYNVSIDYIACLTNDARPLKKPDKN